MEGALSAWASRTKSRSFSSPASTPFAADVEFVVVNGRAAVKELPLRALSDPDSLSFTSRLGTLHLEQPQLHHHVVTRGELDHPDPPRRSSRRGPVGRALRHAAAYWVSLWARAWDSLLLETSCAFRCKSPRACERFSGWLVAVFLSSFARCKVS